MKTSCSHDFSHCASLHHPSFGEMFLYFFHSFLTLSAHADAHAQEDYGTCLVCLCVFLSVCSHTSVNIVHFYSVNKVCTALFYHFSCVDF